MPEAPDLEVIREVLSQRVKGLTVEHARVLRPLELRVLASADFPQDIQSRSFTAFRRRGKFLLMELSGERLLVVNPMLTGVLQLCSPSERVAKRTSFVLALSDGRELRYLDETQMGMAYYLDSSQLAQVPRLVEQGPDVLDQYPSLPDFKDRLRRFQGEIKGILTRGRFISGIGNAYADEVLFAAGIFPFKKRKALTDDDLCRLHETIQDVLHRAISILRERMGDDIHLKVRDFLQVHGKGGSPCPRCGGNITAIGANQRLTNYCRHCQPGMLVRN
ncbi:MAG: Fpg/Nei family DNA glycosylase [Chloroflexi bacterium]|nr:Fpg/Nei family DNA glycosylase [Chloroflexota bacterium]